MLLSIEEISQQLQGSMLGKKLVYCSGTFDLFHVGHLHFLEQAKKLGDILIVGVNSDIIVKKRKGFNRPIISQKDRATLVNSLNFVDFVFIKGINFKKENVIKFFNPDIIVLNNDTNKSGTFLKRIELLKKKNPHTKFVYVKKRKTVRWSTTYIVKKIKGQAK